MSWIITAYKIGENSSVQGLKIFRAYTLTDTSPNWQISQLALPSTGTLRNFCAIENSSPPTAGTPFILCLFFLTLQIYESYF